VEVVSRSVRLPLSAARCRRLLEAAARRVPRRRRAPAGGPAAVTVLFAGEGALRSLNARFRGKDRPTDVLSFPAARPPRPTAWPEGPYLGDLVIGVPVARRNARRHGHSLAREIEMLLLHGYLHLLGYDHERDDGRMERLEKRLRCRLGLEIQAGRAS